MSAKRVVILGAGFGGANVARHLESGARDGELAITIVNRDNYMLFTPMLPEVASGAVEPRHVAPPLRTMLPQTRFELGEVTGVDFDVRSVHLRRRREAGTASVPFDILVLALGAENSTHGIPGAADHTFPLENLHDAIVLRDVAITALENADISSIDKERSGFTTFVVVGGGFTGVEAAGELLSFLRRSARAYPRIDSIRVVLVAGSERLLEELPKALGDAANDMLAARGVEIVLGDEVAAVDAGGLTLRSGMRYESRCIVWSAGTRPARLAVDLALPHSPHHAILVNDDLSVSGTPGVWALGDCAHIPKPGGGSYPHTAQHAVHESRRLARNILAAIRNRKTTPYRYRARGMMASLGAREGLVAIGSRLSLRGFPAWLLWRAYYLSQLPGIDRKARIAFDWTLDLPFPQDIASVR